MEKYSDKYGLKGLKVGQVKTFSLKKFDYNRLKNMAAYYRKNGYSFTWEKKNGAVVITGL